ncbi:hypothetical protein SPSYN_01002 [Sporotomaculum syntrophicum]|uniref:Uncharacterized protein n=1 Tax=Sporotomaculum syntrophicum TaxID=182264 RepID=A0A9D2WRY3_9FIRM|nr:hypothetical protein SPSYN_01002 [Sporotomaculum syntrophicum]
MPNSNNPDDINDLTKNLKKQRLIECKRNKICSKKSYANIKTQTFQIYMIFLNNLEVRQEVRKLFAEGGGVYGLIHYIICIHCDGAPTKNRYLKAC